MNPILEASWDPDSRYRLAVDEIDNPVLRPQHAVIVEIAGCVRQQEVEAAGLHEPGCVIPPMRRHYHVADLLPASFHYIDLGRPAAVIREQPERRPNAGPDR